MSENTTVSTGINRAKPYQLILFPLNNGATNVYYVLILSYVATFGNAVLGSVALYANGKLVGEQSGEFVFTFRIPLIGEIRLEARAGKHKDTATLRQVAKPNPAYRLKKGKSSSANWV